MYCMYLKFIGSCFKMHLVLKHPYLFSNASFLVCSFCKEFWSSAILLCNTSSLCFASSSFRFHSSSFCRNLTINKYAKPNMSALISAAGVCNHCALDVPISSLIVHVLSNDVSISATNVMLSLFSEANRICCWYSTSNCKSYWFLNEEQRVWNPCK